MNLKQRIAAVEQAALIAEDAVAEAIEAEDTVAEASLDLPSSPLEFIANCDTEALLRIEERVNGVVLGHIATDFDRIIKRGMARTLAHHVSDKLKITHERTDHDYGALVHTYRGEVFVFTKEELVELVDDALRVGRLTA